MTLINIFALMLSDIFVVVLLFSSVQEKEKRASFVSLSMLIINTLIWSILIYFHGIFLVTVINYVFLFGFLVLVNISFIKYFPKEESIDLLDVEQYDERDNMFSRNNLKQHPDLAKQYYAMHPEKESNDRKMHQKPDLYHAGTKFFDLRWSPLPEAAFAYLKRTRLVVKGEKRPEEQELDKHKITAMIKEIALMYGAIDIGITKIRKYHYYSHAGRHPENWGHPINNSHTYAIAIIVAMDIDRIKKAPGLPVLIESSRQYVESAKIAHIIAEYIRTLGYDARSHVDGNYEVLCVPVARDAGLGEVGRIGLLMHRRYGPCVRISVVTTELELETSEADNQHMQNFCKICKKCAENCPTHSIPAVDKTEQRGFKHWFINQETCYAFWRVIGSDCAFCIRVCPYTKPNTFLHTLVRYYISRNPVNQHIALFFDDLLFGKKFPVPCPLITVP
ncbi:MAG: hypothetical protein A2Y62_02290 [Candidatus Fischerbacteria bacterium RBG_13_37_8]|uniref:4Fe-4S ferredoxin-type domain-containing protein n=1 Tax=Candidatus Fischerbacteria bacterium RBG_13_37_8 TaxID=1817863 RepID=A0A1F5VPG0_9BACT|nr:MAG: hypothetical protein A2Y62_02290 [Candidatus Fischerbacteria bacterium RBG_13_37_8]